MKLTTDEHGEILLEEVFTGIGFKTENNEIFNICMRDTGYEFNYYGKWYSAKNGKIEPMTQSISKCIPEEDEAHPSDH